MSEPVWVPLGAQPPGGKELAYVERATNLAISATTEATSDVFITTGPVVCDGQPIWIEVYSAVAETASGGFVSSTIWVDGVITSAIASMSGAGGSESGPFFGRRKYTPTPGTHTFSWRAVRGAPAATLYGAESGYMPAYLRITQEDVVPAVIPAGAPPIATALPGSPVDGAEVILTDSLTAGTFHWHFRYVAARATNRWVFVGGAPMRAKNAGPSANLNTSFDNVGTATAPIPVAGEYIVSWGTRFEASGSYPSDMGEFTFSGGGVTDGNTIVAAAHVGGSITNDNHTPHRTYSYDLTAGTPLQPRGRRRSAAGMRLYNMYIEAVPVAVGG